jgi:hypothetical protein
MELLTSPFAGSFASFIDGLEGECLICSPYITAGPVNRLLAGLERKGIVQRFRISVVTDISIRNLVRTSTDIEALLLIADTIPAARITYVPGIHAKVYIADGRTAVVTSANFTEGGSYANLEYGTRICDPMLVGQIQTDIDQYAKLGCRVSRGQLASIRDRIGPLKEAARTAEHTIETTIRREHATLLRDVEDDLIRVRVTGRTPNAIFEDTILYLLRDTDLSTPELHTQIQRLHPDLCDDSQDRVIDGQHFGKLWKHRVRTAQQHLKAKGLIAQLSASRRWSLVRR